MILSISLIVGGFVLLIFGANWLVDGASALAKKFNIPDLVIGLTIVAFGTSAPELVVNLIASGNNLPDLVLGNIIGSNNFNLYFILGIAALIYPIAVKSSTAWKEIPISLLAALILLFLATGYFFYVDGVISRMDGLILLLFFLIFLYYVFQMMKNDKTAVVEEEHVHMSNLKLTLYIIFGLGGLILGGQLTVTHSVKIAEYLGMSEKIIGLTILAAGTSLPELLTSVVAATKKNSDIAIGNVLGSNIFNIFLILGLSAVVNPITYNSKFNLDFYMLIGGTLFLLLAMITGKRKKLDRWEAIILVLVFLGYTGFLVAQEL